MLLSIPVFTAIEWLIAGLLSDAIGYEIFGSGHSQQSDNSTMCHPSLEASGPGPVKGSMLAEGSPRSLISCGAQAQFFVQVIYNCLSFKLAYGQ